MDKYFWVCPDCNRKFSRINQAHTCTNKTIEDHFVNKHKKFKEIFNELRLKLEENHKIYFDPISFTINMKTSRKNFGMFFVEKEFVKVEFFLPYRVNDPRIFKSAGNNKTWTHVVKVSDISQIDQQLLNWLNEAINFNS